MTTPMRVHNAEPPIGSQSRFSKEQRQPKHLSHIPELDGLRGIAILAVLIFHFASQFEHSELLWKLAWLLPAGGWLGVDLFFVLSGFLITRILLANEDSVRQGLMTFWRSRLLRIFPLYYVALVALMALSVPVHFSYWIYSANWWQPFEPASLTSPLSHFWSLAVEEQFYLAWPLVVLCVRRNHLALIVISMIVLAPILRVIFLSEGLPAQLVYRCTITRMDALAFGALVAIGRFPNWLGLAAIPVLVVVGVVSRGPQFGAYWMQTVGYSAAAAVFALGVSWAAKGNVSPLRAGWLRWCGRYSYGAYVLHWPLLCFVRIQDLQSAWSPVVVVVEVVLTLLLARAVFQFVELPFLKLKATLQHREGAVVADPS